MIHTPQKHWRNIERRLHKLYKGAPIHRLMERLEMLVGRYGVGLKEAPQKQSYSQEDSILIVYPDSIQNNSEPPLATLHQFCLQHFENTFNTIHILPFFPSSSDEGFSIINYHQVDSRLGDWKHIHSLSKNFHLMVDLVLNHCSSQSTWFRGFINGLDPYQRYFVTENLQTNLSKVTRPRSTALLNKVSTRDGEMHVWCTFGPDQIDLNWKNPDVLFEFLDILLHYISHGARIIRLDAVAFLWKKVGTHCINLPETHQIVKLFHDFLKIVAPQVLLLTETNIPHQDNISYFGRSDEAHIIYNFALPPLLLHLFLKEDTTTFVEWLKALPTPPQGCTLLNFAASHDGIGLRPVEDLLSGEDIDLLIKTVTSRGGQVSYKTGPNGQQPYELNTTLLSALSIPQEPFDISLKRFLCLHALLLALKGIPALYFNSLLAAPNASYEEGNPRGINRKKWRTPELEKLLENEDSPQAYIFEQLQTLLKIRREQAAFHPDGGLKVYDLCSGVLAFQRCCSDDKEYILCLFNITGSPQFLENLPSLPGNTFQDLITGTNFSLGENITLQPYQTIWGLISVNAQQPSSRYAVASEKL